MMARWAPGWRLLWLDARLRTTHGACEHAGRWIALHPSLSGELLLGTLVHELAHARAGHEADHGPAWSGEVDRICAAERLRPWAARGEYGGVPC
jgi:hypothetical protein